MVTNTRNWIMAGMLGLLVACGGGGGGDSAAGVEPGPAPPNQPIPPTPIPPVPSQTPYAEAEVLNAFITSVTIPADGQPVVDFQLSDGNNVAITDLPAGSVRFTVAKLEASPLGNLTGNWQSYINRIGNPDPEEGPGTEPKLQATYERNAGEFTNNGDGTYRYRMALNVNEPPANMVAQAETEGLNLSYEPDRPNRVAMQFDGAPGKANPNFDWVPATGATAPDVFSMDIAATANCNRCHDPLAIHGGGRREVQYCVTCHNPGSTDAVSGNTVNLKVMVHKIHMGANLPSVKAGGDYIVGGNSYADVHFPQDIRNCVNCHAGSATGTGLTFPDGKKYELTLTDQGDNWSLYASQAACGSCHDDLDFATHKNGQTDDSKCNSCHATDGVAGSIQGSHRILSVEASRKFLPDIEAVNDSMQGEKPVVTFRITNPQTGEDYDILNDPVFAGAALSMRMAWNTTDYTNSGNGLEDASSVTSRNNILTKSTPNGDGSYNLTMPLAIPDGSERPFIPATGSGAAVIEGRLSIALEEGAPPAQVPLTNVHSFFSIDEPNGKPVDRRKSVELNNCLSCHQTLNLHGNNRTDDINSCVTCHNPRNTDRAVREQLANAGKIDPPTDGKSEESLDFKRMVHGIHAAGMREHALQIVGFGGGSVNVYGEEEVQYPGRLSNCVSCHTSSGYTLPLPSGVLATTIDTGVDLQSPEDDTVISPITAVCSSCHDDYASHMVFFGGSFATSQKAINDGDVEEQCDTCHGVGKPQDVRLMHDVD